MADADPPQRVPMPEQQRVLEDFLAAVAAKDIGAITRVLHPDVAVYGDSGGKARTARRPVVGVEKVARFIVGLMEKYGDGLVENIRPVLVNGDLGVVFHGTDDGRAAPRVFTLAVRDGRSAAIFDIVNPDKLTRVSW